MTESPPEQLSTDELVLRQWEVGDAEVFSELVRQNMEHLRPWMPWIKSEPMSIGDRRAMILERRDDVDNFVYGLHLSGVVVGACGLHRRIGPGGFEIGYWVDQHHLGRGLATKAAKLLTGAAFSVSNVDRVEIHHDKANFASSRVPEKLGYSLIGEEPGTRGYSERSGIDCVWRITKSRWISSSS